MRKVKDLFLLSALTDLSLSSCNNQPVPDDLKANQPSSASADSEESQSYQSQSCIAIDTYSADDDLYVSLDGFQQIQAGKNEILNKIILETLHANQILADLHVTLLLTCPPVLFQDEQCRQEAINNENVITKRAEAHTEEEIYLFKSFRWEEEIADLTPEWDFAGHLPYFWQGQLAFHQAHREQWAASWDRTPDGGETFYISTEKGEERSFTENSDCSGEAEGIIPNDFSYQISWVQIDGGVKGSYEYCDLSLEIDQCEEASFFLPHSR